LPHPPGSLNEPAKWKGEVEYLIDKSLESDHRFRCRYAGSEEFIRIIIVNEFKEELVEPQNLRYTLYEDHIIGLAKMLKVFLKIL